MKHLLRMSDLTSEELIHILDLADQLKADMNKQIMPPYLQGKSMGLYFKKSSTRTRISFELGFKQLGGFTVFMNDSTLQSARGEPVQDTARVFSEYLDIMMIRTNSQKEVDDFATYGNIPVINGLSDEEHPCQVIADLMTIREFKKDLKGLKIAFIGDGNNMANSLVHGCILAGAHISIASPMQYTLNPAIQNQYKHHPLFHLGEDPIKAVQNADVVMTDVWASMGDEASSQQRADIFRDTYQVNNQLMEKAKADAFVLHCLPAHREEEITTDIFEKNAKMIFQEANNRLHAQKAIILYLLGKDNIYEQALV